MNERSYFKHWDHLNTQRKLPNKILKIKASMKEGNHGHLGDDKITSKE